jgi:ATP-dependent RNA helicase DeaD
MPKELFQELKKVRVAGQQLNISSLDKAEIKKTKSKKRISSTSRRSKKIVKD